MSTWLRQSTATSLGVGPFVSSGDALTVMASLSLPQGVIQLSVNGAAFAQTINTAGATYQTMGFYGLTLAATDLSTLGRLIMSISTNGVLPVWADYMVLPANVFDSLVPGTDYLDVAAVQLTPSVTVGTIAAGAITAAAISGGAFTSAGFAPNAILAQTVAAVTAGTITDKAGYSLSVTPPTVAQIESQLAGSHGVGSWVDTGAAPTVAQIESQLAGSHGTGSWADSGTPPTALAIADAVWDENLSGHLTTTSAGYKLNAAAAGAAGAGATSWTYTLTDASSALPIADAHVWATSDIAGTTVVASGTTNAAGTVTFYLDSGVTYYIFRAKSGYNFVNPDQETV